MEGTTWSTCKTCHDMTLFSPTKGWVHKDQSPADDSCEKLSSIVKSSCGATSSRKPRFDLIPLAGLIAVANRFELGLEKHGKDNWRKGIGDRDYLIERLAHVIWHAMQLIEKLEGRIPFNDDDDAAAIAWGGLTIRASIDPLWERYDDAGKV